MPGTQINIKTAWDHYSSVLSSRKQGILNGNIISQFVIYWGDIKMFVWKGIEISTHGDVLHAMNIIYESGNKEDAQSFTQAYLAENEFARENMGYLTGYEDPDKMVELQKFFKIAHPVFGYKYKPTKTEIASMTSRLTTISD